MKEYGGTMPEQYDELLKLPEWKLHGQGSVFHRIRSSGSRGGRQCTPGYFQSDGQPGRYFKGFHEKVDGGPSSGTMPKDRASHFNQGLIEIGAIVCVPNGAPHCAECPLESICLAKRHDLIGEIPVKTPPKNAVWKIRRSAFWSAGTRWA